MNKKTLMMFIFSIVLVVLTLLSTVLGLSLKDVYNDSPAFVTIWKSNDLITLIVALPLLIGSMIYYYKKASLKALLVWYSMIWYLAYNYAYYVYGAAFNDLYLLHLFIYTIALGVIVFGLVNFPIEQLKEAIKPSFKKKIVIGEMIFVSLGLTAIYVMQSLLYVFNDTLPAIITMSGHVTSVVFTIDMSMVVLVFVVGIVLLIKNNPWGMILAFIANLKGVIYMSVLLLASIRTNPEEAPIWFMLGILSFISTILLWIGLSKVRIDNK